MKVVIVGAGVIGLMQARELAQKGVDVVLLDKGPLGTEASWAGGGIISPLYPWRYSDAITTLASWSQAYYPDLIPAIAEETGIDPELSNHGLLMLSVDDEDKAVAWSKKFSSWLEVVDRTFIEGLEPNLAKGSDKALWMAQVASVRNPRLLKALRHFATQHKRIEVYENAPVETFIAHNGIVTGVVLQNGERIEADKVLVSSGAWSSGLLDLPQIKIQPVKGQMLVFDAEPGLVNRVVLSNGKYVIPRKDGKVVAGSTLEHTGFDKQTSAEAKAELTDMAVQLYPALKDCEISAHWAGLRPGSPKGMPYIGSLPNHENLYINAGHFRNGLVLAPASVRLMTSILTGEPLPFDAKPYDPARAYG